MSTMKETVQQYCAWMVEQEERFASGLADKVVLWQKRVDAVDAIGNAEKVMVWDNGLRQLTEVMSDAGLANVDAIRARIATLKRAMIFSARKKAFYDCAGSGNLETAAAADVAMSAVDDFGGEDEQQRSRADRTKILADMRAVAELHAAVRNMR